MRKPRALVVGVTVIAACVVTVKTSSFEQETAVVTPGSWDFGTKMVNSTSGSATLVAGEPAMMSGMDTINGISVSTCTDFDLVLPAPMTPSDTPTLMGSGSIPISQVCGAGTGTGCASAVGPSVTCSNSGYYTFYARFTPHSIGMKTCTGYIYYSGTAGSGATPFTLTGSGSSTAPMMDAPTDMGGDGAISDSGSGATKDAGSSGEKDRQTYYACSTGAPAGAAPVALALLALRRRRKLRA